MHIYVSLPYVHAVYLHVAVLYILNDDQTTAKAKATVNDDDVRTRIGMMTRATNNARKRKKMEVAGRGSICSTGTDEKPFVGKMKHNRHRPHRHVYSAVLGSHKIGQC